MPSFTRLAVKVETIGLNSVVIDIQVANTLYPSNSRTDH
jgi:hypothetical protein